MDETIAVLMKQHDVESFTRVGEMKPSDISIYDWYRPILIFEAETAAQNKMYLAFDPKSENLSVLNKE